jgi:hypothetical protein
MGQIIIAVDPGYTTGIVVGKVTGPRDFFVIEAAEYDWEGRFRIGDLLDRYRPSVVVVENFRLYAHSARNQINSPFPSARVIGVVDTFCWERGIEVVMQMPAMRSSVTVLDEHKPILEGSPHTADAYRHLRYYILMNGAKHLEDAVPLPSSSNQVSFRP